MEDSYLVDLLGMQSTLTKDVYYHAFTYNPSTFKKMMQEGIKAKILLHEKGTGYNGLFYVSLSKENQGYLYSAYNLLIDHPAFIIAEKLKSLKTRNLGVENGYPLSFCNTFLPFRESNYDDEYQRFLKVPPRMIKALRFNLTMNVSDPALTEKLELLQNIIISLEEIQADLPIIDATSKRYINKEKVQKLQLKK